MNNTYPDLSIYRLDRQFVLIAIGINLLLAGGALGLAAVFERAWLVIICLVLALLFFVRAVFLWAKPPTVARLDAAGVTVGGALTVKPVALEWKDVAEVALEGNRLVIDRGGDTVVAFPLAYIGRRGREFTREVYDRLNTANGYRRFDPDTDL